MNNLSGHSLQFNIIFIIKTSVLLNRVLGKKWHFSSMWQKGTSLCVCCVFWYINVMHGSIIPGLLTKSVTFFLAPDFINCTISQ